MKKRTTMIYNGLIVITLFCLISPLPGSAVDKPKQQSPVPNGQKVVLAVRTEEPVSIDGRLEEKTWNRPAAEGFTQNDPRDGAPATEKTRVWIAYDDKAVYVAAFCYDSEPRKIVSRLGRRDSDLDSDWFMFAVDPYYDRRTGYLFGVNPAGSILDEALSNDVNDDESWDGVWEGQAFINGQGWTVEMKIPFNQLRFSKKDDYVWGVNFTRIIKRKNEKASFSWVPKNEAAFVSRFARLEGIRNISPGRHVEFLPYAVGQAQFRPAEAGNPFETGRKSLGNAGFDLKVGLKSNLTLDATVNPDFGQVEVDPAVVNLSAYETYYEEKRPFFIEGASIFDNFGRGGLYFDANINWPMPRFFYSRRIGRAPQGTVTQDSDYYVIPDRTTILGAAKITGKLGDWNVGLINALTPREYARLDLLGRRFQEEIEPFTYYGVVRAQKDIQEGQRGFGFIATGVARDPENPVLQDLLSQNAFSLAFDGWTFLDSDRTYVIGGWFGGTRIEGTTENILRLQQSSMHYYQRPDADHVEVNPSATTLPGWGGRLSFARQRGNSLLLFSVGALSPGFDPNDAGFQYSASDVINFELLPAYQWTQPGKIFQQALVAGGIFRTYDFGGNKTWDGVLFLSEGQFRNFWSFHLMAAYNPDSMSNRLTRGGPLALMPWGYQLELRLETDGRKDLVFEAGGMVYEQPRAGTQWQAEVALRWRPSSNFSLSLGPELMGERTDIQWVTRVEDPLMTSTYGARYVFGH
ncbi:MAG: carbohydrate binding family 9 domain-containing protein, partial [Candidatus Aminicenantes bacterium]|nr:carbohydrate binding family 9 domain-containing protein [Candidatus Aminicenantes bacterium]